MSMTIILAETKRSAIQPPIKPHDDVLMTMAEICSGLIKLIELERSGVRHGEGYWVAQDPIISETQRLVALVDQHRTYTISK
jgi:hypothetical protein